MRAPAPAASSFEVREDLVEPNLYAAPPGTAEQE